MIDQKQTNKLCLRWKGKQRRIGITGGIASGKTIIGDFLFQAKQWPIVDADLYAHEALRTKSKLKRGPSIVAIGGGTGLAALLSGLKTHTSRITAIVTVADDGGSSGILRRELGVQPPGDIRNCLSALSTEELL